MATKRMLLNAAALKIYNQSLGLASRLFLDKHPFVTPELVFLAFVYDGHLVYRRLERALRFSREELERKICEGYLQHTADFARLQSETLFDFALKLAHIRDTEVVNEYDLFKALFSVPRNGVVEALTSLGFSSSTVFEIVRSMPLEDTKDETVAEVHDPSRLSAGPRSQSQETVTGQLLEMVGRNLTQLARDGFLEPIWFRDAEIRQASEIICRRSQRNLLLVGEPGVGKTVIVEGLAQKMVAPDCPPQLQGKEIFQLSIASILAGASMRGEFEKRVQQLISDCVARGKVILFFDEVDWLFKPEERGDTADAAQLLKPALTRGELQLIGTITQRNYRTISERSASLLEKFTVMTVRPPSKEQTISLLVKIAPKYEEYHRVMILQDAVHAAVEMADRFLPAAAFPGKAINLMDRAAARLSLGGYDQKCATLRAMGRDDLGAVVSEMTGIEIDKILSSRVEDISRLEAFLKDKIVGQDEAIQKIADTVQVSRSGLDLNERRPDGVFLLVGPTGVGKTEIAKQLAEFLSGSQSKLIRFDMSEFAEEHTVAKLIGAPPGYVGYEDYGQLTEKVRNDPNAVVLFDEIEKAHSRLFNVFLQIFDDGRLTDAHGLTVDFSHTIILMTSNLGARELNGAILDKLTRTDRFAYFQNNLGALIKKHFAPEFLNRLDDIIYLDFLLPETIAVITRKRIGEIIERLRSRGTALQVAPEVYALVEQRGFSTEYGARYLLRTIEDLILKPLAKFLLAQEATPLSVLVTAGKGAIQFSCPPRAAS